jgi:hypothetical protein
MASMAVKWYGKALMAWANKEVDLLDDSIKVMLTTSSYTPDQDVHDYKDDVTNEVSGTNYTAGGQALANDTLTYTAGTNVLKYDADDLTLVNVTLSDVKNAVIYDDTPSTAATKPLIGYGVIDTAVAPNAGNLTVTWDSAGILTATAS